MSPPIVPALRSTSPRQIWTGLPPPARQRLIGQLVFLLRPTRLGGPDEPDPDPADPSPPVSGRVRAPVYPGADRAALREPATPVPTGRPRPGAGLAEPALPGHRR